MISPKPSIVIVPGAWHSASHFASTTSLLESAGYTVHAITLPSVGASPALQDWDLDIATIRSTVEKAIGPDGNRVVIIMHSYGGLPTQDAVYDLDLPTRLAAGQSGGVIRLVYLAAFIGDQGESLADIRADQKSGWIAIDEHSRTATPTVPHEVFYHDVPPALAQTAASFLRPHSVATFHCRLTRPAPWKRIPTTYIVCEDDHATPAAKQDAMIERVRRDPLCKLDTVERVGASHSPFLSVPGWVSGAVRRACGEDVKEV